QLIVTEVSDLGPQRWRGSDGRADRLGQALETPLIGEEFAELLGERGIPGNQALSTRGRPGFDCFEISGNHVIQVRIWRQLVGFMVTHRSTPLTSEQAGEPCKPPPDQPGDGALGAAHILCDDGDRTALQIMHLEYQSLVIGQAGQCRRYLEKLFMPQYVVAG